MKSSYKVKTNLTAADVEAEVIPYADLDHMTPEEKKHCLSVFKSRIGKSIRGYNNLKEYLKRGLDEYYSEEQYKNHASMLKLLYMQLEEGKPKEEIEPQIVELKAYLRDYEDYHKEFDHVNKRGLAVREPLGEQKFRWFMNDYLNRRLMKEPDKVSHELEVATGLYEQKDGQLAFGWNGWEVDETPKTNNAIVKFNMNDSRLTGMQNAIIATFASLFLNWKYTEGKNKPGNWFSYEEIWRSLNGRTAFQTPSKKQIDDLKAEIKKLRTTLVDMDFTDIFKKTKVDITYIDNLIDDGIIYDRMKEGVINVNALDVLTGDFKSEKGQEMHGVYMTVCPLLFAYNYMMKHCVKVEYKDILLVDNQNNVMVSGQYVIEFRDYLANRIMGCKNNTKDFLNLEKIKIATLYLDAGVPTPEERVDESRYSTVNSYKQKIKNVRKSDIDKIKKILTCFTNNGFIKGFDTDGDKRGHVEALIIKL